jgi:hypothetical protein
MTSFDMIGAMFFGVLEEFASCNMVQSQHNINSIATFAFQNDVNVQNVRG